MQVIFENLTFAPFTNAVMMSFISLVIEGQSIKGTKEKLRRDFPPVIFNAWRVSRLTFLQALDFQVICQSCLCLVSLMPHVASSSDHSCLIFLKVFPSTSGPDAWMAQS